MSNLSYRRHRFPVEIIKHAVWLFFRFPLSFRDVEDLLAERGIDVSYETVRRWSIKFGLAYASITAALVAGVGGSRWSMSRPARRWKRCHW